MDEMGVPQYGNLHIMQTRLKSMKLIEHCLVVLVFEHEWGVFEPVPAFVVISSIWSDGLDKTRHPGVCISLDRISANFMLFGVQNSLNSRASCYDQICRTGQYRARLLMVWFQLLLVKFPLFSVCWIRISGVQTHVSLSLHLPLPCLLLDPVFDLLLFFSQLHPLAPCCPSRQLPQPHVEFSPYSTVFPAYFIWLVVWNMFHFSIYWE